MNNPARIQLCNVTKVYSTGSGRTLAVQEISFTVEPHEFFVILGPSGCGKSTLINLIAGFTHCTEGTIYIGNKPVREPGSDRVVVFQDYGLFAWKTVLGNVEFGLKARGIPREERRAIALEYLELVHLTKFADRYPYELSGGMKQRLALARALAVRPVCILMDEPLGSLDSQLRQHLQGEVMTIWHTTGQTIIMVTHDVDEAIYLGDRVLVMTHRPGRVKEIVPISLPRPRQHFIRTTPEFQSFRKHIWTLLEMT